MLDLGLMTAAFAAVRSGDATLLRCTFGLHFLAALTVSYLVPGVSLAQETSIFGVCCRILTLHDTIIIIPRHRG